MSIATLCALGAIALWGGLAWLGVRLAAVPPFLLVGTALTIVGVLATPTWRQWRVRPVVLAVGIYGLFGFHFFLFIALRLAPPLPANLVNYLWPLLIVLLAPLFVGTRLTRWHVAGAVLGFAGAILAIGNGRVPTFDAMTGDGTRAAWGYAAALTSAVIWATYSLMGQRLRKNGIAFPTAAIGAFCLASGLLALACHVALEPAYAFTRSDVLPLAVLALGPDGRGLLPVGRGARARRRAHDRHARLSHAAGVDDPPRPRRPVALRLADRRGARAGRGRRDHRRPRREATRLSYSFLGSVPVSL